MSNLYIHSSRNTASVIVRKMRYNKPMKQIIIAILLLILLFMVNRYISAL